MKILFGISFQFSFQCIPFLKKKKKIQKTTIIKSIKLKRGGSKAGSALCSSFLIKFVRRMQSKYSSVLSFWLFCGYQMLLSGTIHLAIGSFFLFLFLSFEN